MGKRVFSHVYGILRRIKNVTDVKLREKEFLFFERHKVKRDGHGHGHGRGDAQPGEEQEDERTHAKISKDGIRKENSRGEESKREEGEDGGASEDGGTHEETKEAELTVLFQPFGDVTVLFCNGGDIRGKLGHFLFLNFVKFVRSRFTRKINGPSHIFFISCFACCCPKF
jgi:hypothetical protein